MPRWMLLLALAVVLSWTLAAAADDTFVPPGKGSPGGPGVTGDRPRAPAQDDFQKLARLSSRLTSYNSHDDAATATYTCCRPDQKEQIAKAERANDIFLKEFPRSDFADDTLFHQAALVQLEDNYAKQIEYYSRVANEYPGSDYADDALWRLAEMYAVDTSSARMRAEALERIVRDYPMSLHVGNALAQLTSMAITAKNLGLANQRARELATRFPGHPRAAASLWAVAAFAQQSQSPDLALDLCEWIAQRYPFCDCYDDALYLVPQILVAKGAQGPARGAYERFMSLCPSSAHFRDAVQEYSRITGKPAPPGSPSAAANEATRLWEAAQGFQRYRQFADAVAAYNDFIRAFPTEKRTDDAIYQIGMCFKETNNLCNQVNDAEGPDQLFRLRESWALATRGGDVSRARGAEAAGDASQAFMDVAFRCPGTELAAEALYQLSQVFEDMKALDLQAEVYQRIVIDYPTSDPDHSTQALAGLLKWYVEKAKWPEAVPLYQALGRAYPMIFPPELAQNTDLLVSMLKLYEAQTAHGWYERHLGHVRNRSFGPGDLIDDSNYVIGSLLVSAGQTKEGLARLRAVMNTPTSDFAAPALYNIAKAYELEDKYTEAAEIYRALATQYDTSGLADDAQDCLAMIDGKKDVAPAKEALAKAEKALGRSLTGYDFYVGKHVVVFSPYMSAAKMRAYNMPQIWDQAQESLAKWTGLPEHLSQRQVIVLTEEPSPAAGEIIRLPASEVTDPPNWGLGLRELTQNYLSDPALGIVAGMSPAVAEALTSLGTAHLQYALVSETRDTIGSASAVKLPFENLIREREASRAALEKYVQEGAGGLGKLSRESATGMMLALLDQYGYGESGIIDCSPLKGFFSMVEEAASTVDTHNRQACTLTVVRALCQAFNADVSPFFRQWGILEG